MTPTELALRMLEWGNLMRQADVFRLQIEAEVLARGKTHTVGAVRASYSAGRKHYNYAAAVINAIKESELDPDLLSAYESTVCDYHRICKDFGIDAPFAQSSLSVTVKLLE